MQGEMTRHLSTLARSLTRQGQLKLAFFHLKIKKSSNLNLEILMVTNLLNLEDVVIKLRAHLDLNQDKLHHTDH